MTKILPAILIIYFLTKELIVLNDDTIIHLTFILYY